MMWYGMTGPRRQRGSPQFIGPQWLCPEHGYHVAWPGVNNGGDSRLSGQAHPNIWGQSWGG